MTKHAKSLFSSLLIHILLFGGVFYVYTCMDNISFQKTKKTEEQRVCIKLGTLQEQRVLKKTTDDHIAKKRDTLKNKKEVKKSEVSKKERKRKSEVKQQKKKLQKQKVSIKPQKKEEPKKTLAEKPTIKSHKQSAPSIEEKKVTPKEVVKEEGSKTEEDCPMVCCQTIPSKEESYKNDNLQKIVQLLSENLYYPRRARKRAIEGEVLVRFTLMPDASVDEIEIISSANSILSRGAIKTLQNLSGEFPKPPTALVLTVPIKYYLLK
jgi:protein TonB